MKVLIFLTYFFYSVLMVSCTHSVKRSTYGLQEHSSNYLPARIVVMPCSSLVPKLLWNDDSQSKQLIVDQKDTDSLCAMLDEFVIKGFENQPFMRGFSPKTTRRLLEDSKQKDLMTSWMTIIDQSVSARCKECSNLPESYDNTLGSLDTWLMWLAELSLNTKHSDAVLFPFVAWQGTKTGSDRGLQSHERTARIELMLVDSSSGKLIWSGTRHATAINRQLSNVGQKATLKAPEIMVLKERLFTNDLWKDFPGRQNF